MKSNEEPLLYSAKQASEKLGISRSLFYELHAEGKVPAPIKLGGRVLWRREELCEWIDAGCPCRMDWEQIRSTSLTG